MLTVEEKLHWAFKLYDQAGSRMLPEAPTDNDPRPQLAMPEASTDNACFLGIFSSNFSFAIQLPGIPLQIVKMFICIDGGWKTKTRQELHP
jgi:hypothetical protein